jgi:hypothetical protein
MNHDLPPSTLLYSSNLDAKFGTPTLLPLSQFIDMEENNGSALHPPHASTCPVRPQKLMWQAVVGLDAPHMSSTKSCA